MRDHWPPQVEIFVELYSVNGEKYFCYDLGIKQIFGQCGISENCFSTNEIVLVYERVKSCISCLL